MTSDSLGCACACPFAGGMEKAGQTDDRPLRRVRAIPPTIHLQTTETDECFTIFKKISRTQLMTFNCWSI